jgi:hypothetical protein
MSLREVWSLLGLINIRRYSFVLESMGSYRVHTLLPNFRCARCPWRKDRETTFCITTLK